MGFHPFDRRDEMPAGIDDSDATATPASVALASAPLTIELESSYTLAIACRLVANRTVRIFDHYLLMHALSRTVSPRAFAEQRA